MKVKPTFLFVTAALILMFLLFFFLPSEAQIPAAGGGFWYKGNTHTHAKYSDTNDENDVPEIASWYRKAGYNFLVLSEHNDHLLKKQVFCYDKLNRPRKNFIMLCGLELSMSRHITALGIDRFIAGEKSILEGVNRTLEAGGVPVLNHPQDPVITAQKFVDVNGLNHLEIVNGGRMWDTPASEALWDSVMSLPGGRIVYAVASDDNHYCSDRVGKGWIFVRANSLTSNEIKENIRSGNFYPSTGVILNDYSFKDNLFSLSSQNGDTIKFIGEFGKILDTFIGKKASYQVTGNEVYIRAKVTNRKGESAWTQPVVINKK